LWGDVGLEEGVKERLDDHEVVPVIAAIINLFNEILQVSFFNKML
jgi:hypothetical protein